MLVSLNWLSEFCDWPDTNTLVNDLNRIGFEVESVTQKGVELSRIVIGVIEQFEPHPDADRLRVAQVNIGNERVQIVTAADNVSLGDAIPVSLPGATLAGGLNIKSGTLRGVISNGMMCSAVECGLTDTSPGVWVLPPDAPVGECFITVAGLVDTVLDISILPNRGDALSYMGLARECGVLYGNSKKINIPSPPKPHGSSNATCAINDPFCSYYSVQKISGIHHRYTPLITQTRLYYTGFRPVSWIVDVTNVAMCETGQPLHAYDARKISHFEASLSTAASVQLLNEKECRISNQTPVIMVDGAIGALAGVMGAMAHSVGNDTTDIYLEAAQFEASVIRKTSKDTGIRTESSIRFERHTDASALLAGVARVCELLGMVDDIQVNSPVSEGSLGPDPVTIPIDIEKINQLLGTLFTDQDISDRLTPLGFECNGDVITVPSWRVNDCHEWPDIAEELCRFYGMDRISSVSPEPLRQCAHDAKWIIQNRFHQTAILMGLTEVIPFPLTKEMRQDQPSILNPISTDLVELRSMGIESLLTALQFNSARHSHPCRLFSIGPVWSKTGVEGTHFSAVVQGPLQYQPYLPDQTNQVNFYDIKGLVDRLLTGIDYKLDRCNHYLFHPGQSAVILVNNRVIGWFGMAHPVILSDYKLIKTGLIELNVLGLNSPKMTLYSPVSKYPATTRDVTYIMNKSTSVAEVLDILNQFKPNQCVRITLCGYYLNPKSDDVSASFRMIYQDDHSSLEMEAVNQIHQTFARHVIDKIPCRFP
jgi:phenylalanyl-tRNA synthetase beta chain